MPLPRISDYDIRVDDLDFVRAALREPLPEGKDVLCVTIPAPSEALEKFMRLVPRDMGFLWKSHGMRLAGGGAVAVVEAVGMDRLAKLRAGAQDLWRRVEVRMSKGGNVRPALLGGIAFSPEVPEIEPWEEFTTDAFALPRWGYQRVGDQAYLTLALREHERRDPDAVDALLDELGTLLQELETESPTSLIERLEIPRSAVHYTSLDEWQMYLASVIDAIRSGEYDKIVAARRCVVDVTRPLEDTAFMARLAAAYPLCTQFAVRRRSSTFVGATPETLFHKVGQQVRSEALAGTMRIADKAGFDTVESAALRRSLKDLTEHALVVKRICEELMPLCKRLRYASGPQTRQVRNLVHLHTPITGELRPEYDAFDLLASLHPTPAVGGFPSREAAVWLRNNEPMERGWYTGAIGWIDSAGDAEFAVAIRCGVMTPRRVHIYAGAGIVASSDPEAEYRETAAKMEPLLRTLGVV